MHRGHDRVIAGVASGVAEALNVDALLVRVGFVVLAVAGGIGVPLYFGLWFLMPGPDGERFGPVGPRERDRFDLHRTDLRKPVAIGLIVAGVVLLLRNVAPFFSDQFVWPMTLAGFGIAVLWARSGEDERQRLTQAAGRPLQALIGGRQAALRLALGGVLVFAGIGVFLAANDALTAARQVGLAVLVTIAGLFVILGPWVRRLVLQLRQERRDRIRSEERAEVAAHLHDSVLQTLALIQRNADRPRELAALARRQERELRTWLYGDRLIESNGHRTLSAAVDAMVSEVEDLHGIEVEVVTVGECPVDGRVDALLQAAREATVNAAKHAGVDTVSLYVEVEPDRITAFVRDRGCGFDTSAAPPDDRRGIASSIRDRMQRNGGTATIASTPGEGTEVMLELKRQ